MQRQHDSILIDNFISNKLTTKAPIETTINAISITYGHSRFKRLFDLRLIYSNVNNLDKDKAMGIA